MSGRGRVRLGLVGSIVCVWGVCVCGVGGDITHCIVGRTSNCLSICAHRCVALISIYIYIHILYTIYIECNIISYAPLCLLYYVILYYVVLYCLVLYCVIDRLRPDPPGAAPRGSARARPPAWPRLARSAWPNRRGLLDRGARARRRKRDAGNCGPRKLVSIGVYIYVCIFRSIHRWI